MLTIVLVLLILLFAGVHVLVFFVRRLSLFVILAIVFFAGFAYAKEPALTVQTMRAVVVLLSRLLIGLLQALLRLLQ